MSTNVNAPRGLAPVGTLTGAPWNASVQRCFIAAANADGAMYIGDPVDIEGASDTPGQHPTVKLATVGATNPIFGVIVAIEYDPTDLSKAYRPALTARYCYVCTDPNTIYHIQADGDAVLAYTVVGGNANLASGAGSAYTNLSGWQMDTTGAGTADATYQLLILGFDSAPDNNIALTYGKWLVKLNLTRYGAVYTGGAWYGPKGIA